MQNQLYEPLIDLKINQPLQQQMPPQMPQIYPSPYVPIPNPYYPYAGNGMYPWQYTPNNVPIIKKYNISLGNANGDVTRIANLFEDILPSVNGVILNTFNTLNERLILHNYIRSIFIKTGDGERLLINGGPNNSNSEVINLLGHVKLLDRNPYHYSYTIANPMKSMQVKNFVMFRSCYPIKMGKYHNIDCATSSIGMNIRMYLLTAFDVSINYKDKSDIYRELWYYEYIKKEIIKKKISPNFITLHSYYLTENSGIDFIKQTKLQILYDKNNNYEIRYNMFIDDKFNDRYNFLEKISKRFWINY